MNDIDSFLALHDHISPRAITEFVYRYSSATRAFVFLSFYLTSPSLPGISSASTNPSTTPVSGASTPRPTPQAIRQEELSDILSSLKTNGMNAVDLSDNELAKSHARYMVGGKANVDHERVFRFEFPERPGALKKFLAGLKGKGKHGEGNGLNISLFHYRNHGGGEL
jgi:threonine dehydratase